MLCSGNKRKRLVLLSYDRVSVVPAVTPLICLTFNGLIWAIYTDMTMGYSGPVF